MERLPDDGDGSCFNDWVKTLLADPVPPPETAPAVQGVVLSRDFDPDSPPDAAPTDRQSPLSSCLPGLSGPSVGRRGPSASSTMATTPSSSSLTWNTPVSIESQKPPLQLPRPPSKSNLLDDTVDEFNGRADVGFGSVLQRVDNVRDSLEAGPEADPWNANAEELIVRELNELTLRERERIYEDVHGINTDILREDPEVIRTLLDDMQVELILTPAKPAYDRAMQLSPTYVENRSLRLCFLRAEKFDAAKAAAKFVRFLELKRNLFGDELLCKDITLDDLPPDAQTTLRSGRMQLLPRRDIAGRTVICDVLSAHAATFKSTESMIKAGFYFCMSVLSDEETQKTGIICIHYAHSYVVDLSREQRNFFWQAARLMATVPAKFQAFHFVADSNSLVMRQCINLLQLGIPKDIRHRFRTHFGSMMETQYVLMGYGIPISLLPITEKGVVRIENHRKWVEYREQKETMIQRNYSQWAQGRHSVPQYMPAQVSAMSHVATDEQGGSSGDGIAQHADDDSGGEGRLASDIRAGTTREDEARSASPPKTMVSDMPEPINLPSRYDVLLGRGRPFQEHSGNRYLRDLIVEWFARYNKATKVEKTALAQHLMRHINSKGGRFLKKNSNGSWVQAGFVESRTKVSHTFRKKRESDMKNEQKRKSTNLSHDPNGSAGFRKVAGEAS